MKAHDLERVLNEALNLIARQAPGDPWSLLARALPPDIAVPGPPTVPFAAAEALQSEFDRLKHDWLVGRGSLVS